MKILFFWKCLFATEKMQREVPGKHLPGFGDRPKYNKLLAMSGSRLSEAFYILPVSSFIS